MTPFSANPFVWIFSVVALLAVAVFFAWGSIDRLALSSSTAQGKVTGKRYNPPSVTYRTNIVAGRAWTQGDSTPETYVLSLQVAGEPTVALVGKPLYDATRDGDVVQLQVQRTRLTRQLLVVDVAR